VTFQAFDETAADGVHMQECPSCRAKFPTQKPAKK
jgi:hypothetical protein